MITFTSYSSRIITDLLIAIMLLISLFLFFIHLKLELETQFPASSDNFFFTIYGR